MTTTPALFSPTASAPASSASSAKAVGAADAGEQMSFATVLAGTTADASATPQAGTAPAPAPTANAATLAAQIAGAAASTGDAAAAPVEGETQSTDAVATPDPTVMIAGTTTQQQPQAALAIPAMPAAVLPVVDASAEGAAQTDAETPEAGAAMATAGPMATAGQPVAGIAGAPTPVTAQAAALAAPAATQAASTPAQADADAAEAIDAASTTNSSSASGQTPSKASATGVQTSPAQGAPAMTAANAAAAAQVEVTVDAASSLQSKAGAITEAVATTTTTTQHASGAASASHAAQTAAPAATLQVYTRFVERFDGRAQRFEVRLDPAELGRVDVRIEIGADKKVHAVLAAHDSAALNDLMRGHRALERMLTDAGIDLADGGVKFELAGDSGRNATPEKSDTGSPSPNVWRRFDTIDIPLEAAATATPQPWQRTRLDLVA